jgi:hypothetical protein
MSATLSTHALAKPVISHGGESVSELTLRTPSSKDVMELGYPMLIINSGGEQAIEIRPKVVGKYISRLAAVPMGAVEALAIADLQALIGIVMGFFGQGDGEVESTTTPTP